MDKMRKGGESEERKGGKEGNKVNIKKNGEGGGKDVKER